MDYRSATAVVLLASLAWAQAEPTVPKSVRLEGRVLDMRGEPVPVAAVTVATQAEPDTVLARATTDGDGFFVLPSVPRREHLLVAATAAGCCAVGWPTAPDPVHVEVLLREAVVVRGKVTNRAGLPVADVEVEAVAAPELRLSSAHAGTRTAADGSFVLTKAPLGPMCVSAVVPGEGLAVARIEGRGDAQVTLAPGNGAETSIEVRITGVPPATKDLVRITLELFGGQRLRRLPPAWRRPVCDEQGRLQLLQVPDLDFTLEVSVPGFVVNPGGMQLLEGRGPHRAEFHAAVRGVGSRTARGTLRLAAGDALAAVPLELQVGRYSYDAVTDERGNFLFTHQAMPNLGCSIRLHDDRWVLDQDRAADLIASDRPVELRAVVASEIKGRVQRADGQPAAGARIALEQQGEDGVWNPVAFGRSSRDGSFRLPRLHSTARPLRLTLQSRDGNAIADVLTMTLPGARVDLGVVKLDESARVEGVVRDAAGQPLTGVVVSLDHADSALDPRRGGTETVTDRLGRYRFAGVKPGEASLRLFLEATDRQRGDRAVEPFEVAPGETRTIDLTTKGN